MTNIDIELIYLLNKNYLNKMKNSETNFQEAIKWYKRMDILEESYKLMKNENRISVSFKNIVLYIEEFGNDPPEYMLKEIWDRY